MNEQELERQLQEYGTIMGADIQPVYHMLVERLHSKDLGTTLGMQSNQPRIKRLADTFERYVTERERLSKEAAVRAKFLQEHEKNYTDRKNRMEILAVRKAEHMARIADIDAELDKLNASIIAERLIRDQQPDVTLQQLAEIMRLIDDIEIRAQDFKAQLDREYSMACCAKEERPEVTTSFDRYVAMKARLATYSASTDQRLRMIPFAIKQVLNPVSETEFETQMQNELIYI